MKKIFDKMTVGQQVYTQGLIRGGILTICFASTLACVKSFVKVIKNEINLVKKIGKVDSE